MGLRQRVMGIPRVYESLQDGIWKPGSYPWIANDVISYRSGMRILDIGCGTAKILNFLDGVNYIGIDHNREYIEQNRKNFGNRGHFVWIDTNDTKFDEFENCDVVLILGVLHHLNDHEVHKVLSGACKVLQPEGRLVIVEPLIAKGQHPIARLLAELDRGRFVRSSEEYRELISSPLDISTATIRHDLLRVPYSQIVLDVRKIN